MNLSLITRSSQVTKPDKKYAVSTKVKREVIGMVYYDYSIMYMSIKCRNDAACIVRTYKLRRAAAISNPVFNGGRLHMSMLHTQRPI